MTPAQFKRLVQKKFPGAEVKEQWEMLPKYLGGERWKVVIVTLHHKVQVRFGRGDAGICLHQEDYPHWRLYLVQPEDAVALGQALLDAAAIVQEINNESKNR